ncbi:MAG: hypothetical protein DI534_10815 [Leifsonia xyli]|nr:MAG: hypothetical protein DI534_10815 [Leifsonia xyli]
MLERVLKDEGLAYSSQGTRRARRNGLIPKKSKIEQRWVAVARKVAAKIDAAAHGERADVFARLAEPLGMSPGYLRRAVSTYKFIETKPFPDVALASFPIAVVEELRRWHRRNKRGAHKAALEFAAGDQEIDDFIEEARKARPNASVKDMGARTPHAFRALVRETALDRFPDYELDDRTSGLSEGHTVLRRQVEGGDDELVVVVSAGPLLDKAAELTRCREALQQAMGFILTHHHVVLACASARAKQHAEHLLDGVRAIRGVWNPDIGADKLEGKIVVWNLGADAAEEAPSDETTPDGCEADGGKTSADAGQTSAAAKPDRTPAPAPARAGRTTSAGRARPKTAAQPSKATRSGAKKRAG